MGWIKRKIVRCVREDEARCPEAETMTTAKIIWTWMGWALHDAREWPTMSYIRSLSNPEALYVYEDIEDARIHWSWTVKKPLSNGECFVVPKWAMHRVALKFEDGREQASAGGFSAREQYVYLDTGRLADESKTKNRDADAAVLIRIEYKGTYVYLWAVTWKAVVRSVVWHEKTDKTKRKRRG
jgi:hypothetical protein